MDQHITPKLLREYAQRIAIQPPGAQDPQDWDEMTTMFARAFNAAAAEIERITAEVAVRDRALEEACKTRPLLLCNTPGAGDCRHQTAEFYMQIAREALAREQEAASWKR